jgi:mycothiol synthase
LDAALVSAGFRVSRELAYMSIDLPMDGEGAQVGIRPLQSEDTRRLLAINRAAFSTHREAGSMDEKEFHALLAQAGMGASGVLIYEEGGEMAGFCWTRVHENGEGEIFRIAVAPESQGGGLGRALVRAGFDYLARQQNVSAGTLWVDTSNENALRLYKDIGMAEIRFNREFEVPTPRK